MPYNPCTLLSHLEEVERVLGCLATTNPTQDQVKAWAESALEITQHAIRHAEQATAEHSEQQLHSEDEHILYNLALRNQQPATADTVGRDVNLSAASARYFLDHLTRIGFIRKIIESDGYPPTWLLEKAGRKYLDEEGIL